MLTIQELHKGLRDGSFDGALLSLYARDGSLPAEARERAVRVTEGFTAAFHPAPDAPAALISGPGRTEIGGNHTDHQRGHVLCASVNMDILACAAPNGTQTVRVVSEGYSPLEIPLDSLAAREEEKNTSAALIRGIAARITELGYSLSGLDIYAVSDVLSGSGLSSSAAYEIMIGCAFSHFFCGGALDAVQLAKIGQYAENVYFGKPCGLMDQMGSAVGGAVAIDFRDPADPVTERVDYDFSRSGHALCIVDTGSCHADLTNDYADIPREMGAVAAFFGRQFLREVPESDFRAALPALRKACGDRAVLRAMHFYADDRRAVREADALRNGDFGAFLSLVNESGLSSALLLQNIWPASDPAAQAVSVALAAGRDLLEGTGAIRVHGGGFAGTIQAFVPNEKVPAFRSGMEAVLGAGMCHILQIRPRGGCVVVC